MPISLGAKIHLELSMIASGIRHRLSSQFVELYGILSHFNLILLTFNPSATEAISRKLLWQDPNNFSDGKLDSRLYVGNLDPRLFQLRCFLHMER
ncbi:hypothetical protein Pfo_014771 [Paulownia fortunei]|nr:hypothetical protein Pfo_014771 [Paulownia fortunei]